MAIDKKISELPAATVPLSGTEKFEILQGGVNKQVDASDVGSGGSAATETAAGIAELATQAETNTGTDDARIVTPLKFNTKLRATRTVVGADAVVQADDNSLIIFNSATPFNFTLDQITAASKVSFLNIGAGAVTLVAGSGVTITGPTVIAGSVGTSYPSGLVFYHTATTPRVVTGSADADLLDELEVATAGATITQNFGGKVQRIFTGDASFATAKVIAFSNDSAAKAFNAEYNITNVAATIEFPSSVFAQTADSRFNNTTHLFTAQPTMTGIYNFSAVKHGARWEMQISTPFGT